MTTTEQSLFTSGIQSNTIDNMHIFMADFDVDKSLYSLVVDAILYLQETYKLSDVYLYETKNGYHAFSMDKLELDFLSNMLYSIPIIDDLFIYFALERGFFVLRWGKDKKYLCTLYSNNLKHEKSLAHYKFFTEIINTNIILDEYYDKNYEFEIIIYRSEKHGWFNYDIDG